MKARFANQRGAASWVSLLLIAGIAAGAYFGLMYGPAYFEQIEVKQMLREQANTASRVPDEALKANILNKAKQIGSHTEIQNGQEMNIPGIVLLDDDVYITRDDTTQMIIIQVSYAKRLDYPFTKKQKEIRFSPSVKESFAPVRW
jgi:hypothetical protein